MVCGSINDFTGIYMCEQKLLRSHAESTRFNHSTKFEKLTEKARTSVQQIYKLRKFSEIYQNADFLKKYLLQNDAGKQ